jgi:predicted transcriptional regulator
MTKKDKNAWQLSIRTPEDEREKIEEISEALGMRKGDFMEIAANSLIDRIENGESIDAFLLPPDDYESVSESRMMTVTVSPEVKLRVKQIVDRLRQRKTTFFLWAAMLEYHRWQAWKKLKRGKQRRGGKKKKKQNT